MAAVAHTTPTQTTQGRRRRWTPLRVALWGLFFVPLFALRSGFQQKEVARLDALPPASALSLPSGYVSMGMALSPDGKVLAVVDQGKRAPDGMVRPVRDIGVTFWEATKGRRPLTRRYPLRQLPRTLSFTSDSKHLVLANYPTLQLLDWQASGTMSLPPFVWGISPDGRVAVRGTHQGGWSLIEPNTRRVLQELRLPDRVPRRVLYPWLLSQGATTTATLYTQPQEGTTLVVWKRGNPDPVAVRSLGQVLGLPAMSPDGRLLLTREGKDTVICRALETGETLWQRPLPFVRDPVAQAGVFSPRGDLVAFYQASRIVVCIAKTGAVVKELPRQLEAQGNLDSLLSRSGEGGLAFTPDGAALLERTKEKVIFHREIAP